MAVYGFAIVKNVPTANNSVLKLAGLIGSIQSTMYGEMFDVKIEKQPSNVTQGNQGIPLHMDFLNYESPPGFHFLSKFLNKFNLLIYIFVKNLML